ncbi:HDR186Cp [Eremothecium sinecaudum]|uniref:Protein farnesyltransferase/geranylgeranyltransferase type-1 subunit alpha n=1 Tax=Eremothecium sinecaudum TaxID=45286 RepID=A0A109UZW1_9SACH|nr:HDR186Cp [Eremothecium sinecaudum]AMD20928.1 HDR186Cp [Eremothecium sinecaudum]
MSFEGNGMGDSANVLAEYDFSDVRPVEIGSESNDGLCEIMYSEDYKKLAGLLQGLLNKGEKSQRALEVTTVFLDISPAYYTAWNYRFMIISELYGKDSGSLNKELDWLDEFTLSNPKNYQIWSYRQALMQLHPSPSFSRELPILRMMLDDDTKNYHVWSYRRWAVQHFGDFSEELKFAEDHIDRDVYNNSAWAHKMFVYKNLGLDDQSIALEVEYVCEKINMAPQNPSTWNYLKGLYEQFKSGDYSNEIIHFALTFVNGFFDEENEAPEIQSSYALELLAELYSKKNDTIHKAKKAYQTLSSTYDPIRKNYWQYRLNMLV